MMSALGRAFVLLALLFATSGAVMAFAAALLKRDALTAWARRAAYGFAFAAVAANATMITALLRHDFSVSYVARVGSRSVPTWVTVVSLWSSLEGSILFWSLLLALFVGISVRALAGKHPAHEPWMIGILLGCAAFFAFLVAGPADPFVAVPFPPADGPGPNPLLQNHILMVVHPPMLYLGYTGMVVPFAIAGAALFAGRAGTDIMRSMRMALLVPWVFLTFGIVLGGWWSYEVLGWGGYWAWDPVENASLLPWLTATAGVHSIMVAERRSMMRAWSLVLVPSTFLLTILGTFMTRSGVFNSVHAFAQSDIGPTFLVFLAVTFVGTVFLLSARLGVVQDENRVEHPASREAAVVFGNFVLVLLTLTVLLGTVFPLIAEAARGVRISVGEPYFNRMGIPLGIALLFLVGVGPALPWRTPGEATTKSVVLPIGGLVVAVLLAVVFGARDLRELAALGLAGYGLVVTVRELLLPVVSRPEGKGFGEAVGLLLGAGRRRFGGYITHLGFLILMVGVAVSSSAKVSVETTLKPGERAKLGPYELVYQGARTEKESHRDALVARVAVEKDGRLVTTMEPRLNYYFSQREPVGTPEVYTTLREDVYLSVMSIDEQTQTLGLRAFVNPMVVWIWIGGVVCLIGGLVLLIPRRRTREATAPVAATEPAGLAPATGGGA